MPYENDPPIKKVKVAKPRPKELEEDAEEEVQKGPNGQRPSGPSPQNVQKPVTRHYDEVVLAETRTAKPSDGANLKGDEDPAELLGMGKIGVLPKGAPLEEPKKEEPPEEPPEEPSGPEPKIEEAIQEGPVEEDAPFVESDEGTEATEKLPPPPIPQGAKEVKPPQDLLANEDGIKEQEIELKEVAIGRDGRKIKVLTVKPGKLPPPTDEETEPDAVMAKPGLSKGGIRDLSPGDSDVPLPKGHVRRSAGLGVDVELDAETIRKLSAPVLPAQFGYPKRAFHSRFRRYILFFILPALFLLLIFAWNIVNPVTEMTVALLFFVVLAGLIIYGISPFYTTHMVTKAAVLLKHGVYFEARIPLAEIRTAKIYEERAGMMGIRVDSDRRLFALSDRKDMVELILKAPTTVASRHKIESVVTNVEEPNVFVKTVKAAIAAQAEESWRTELPGEPIVNDDGED
jgi:hypothetical protein